MLNKEAVIDTLRRNRGIFREKYGILELYLYGSFARNNASNESDVDVLLDAPRKYKKYKNYLEMKYFLQKEFNREVDLVYMDSLNPLIKEEIKEETIKIE
jgi:predicted nucleotidyltransferase